MTDNQTCYHTKLKEQLLEKNISQGKAAEVLGMDRAWFNLIINRKVRRKLTWDEVELLCETFEINIKRLNVKEK